MKSMRLLAFTFVTCVALSGFACSETATPSACTEEFRTYVLTVLDDARQPVPDVALARVNQRTGVTLTSGWLGMLVPGSYLVADDGMLDAFSGDGDTLRVSGVKGTAGFTVDFAFATPEPCRCHVVKQAGPDTTWIAEPPPR